jgi:predicted permease
MGWRRFFRRSWWDEERTRELEAHLEIEADENVERGMSPQEARKAALRKLGNLARIREEIYMMNSVGLLETFSQDLRYGVRQVRHNPGFATLAVLTLALGIGSVTVMYSVIRNVLLDPFPYTNSERLVDVLVRDMTRPDAIFRGALPVAEFLDYQEQSRVFEDVAGAAGEAMNWTTKDGAERVVVVHVTPNTFQFLGVAPLLGRTIVPDDGRPGAPPVAVLSYGAWRSRFGGDPSIVGETIVLNGEPRTVVGVMPPRFAWHVADVWITESLDRTAREAPSTVRWFQAHLKPGVTLAQAEAELNLIAARRAGDHPDEYPKQFRIQVLLVIDFVVGRYRRVLYTLFAAVGLLLLIACCNVASMLLARATAREGELTIRAALGAGRGRIVRQLLIESLLLALVSAAAGCFLAYAGVQALAHVMPRQNVPYETDIRLDRPVLLFSLATAVLSAMLSGLLPALHAARRDLVAGLRQSGKGAAGGFRHGRIRNGLVVVQVALSLVLLLGAGLLMRTFLALVRVDLGFDPTNIVFVPVALSPGQSANASERHRFFGQALERVAALPGVVAVAETTSGPPFGGGLRSELRVAGRSETDPDTVIVRLCSEGFIRVIGTTILGGRRLSDPDIAQARRVAVVNQSLVAKYFPDQQAIGKQITLPRLKSIRDPVADPVFEVVGIVRDVRNSGIRDAPVPEVLLPSTTSAGPSRVIVARTSVDPALVVNAIRREVRAIDRSVALTGGGTLEDELRQSFYAQPRFSLIVLAAFAGTGLALVALGIYGVLAYTVSRQTHEIAVRMALGAGRNQVLRLVLRLGLQLIAAGVAAGLAAGAATHRLIAHQLWNISPHDPLTLVGAVAVIAVVGLAACYAPAARAMRVEPMAALRLE